MGFDRCEVENVFLLLLWAVFYSIEDIMILCAVYEALYI